MDYSGDIFKQSMIIDGTVVVCIGNSLSSPNPKRDGTRMCSNFLHSKKKPLHRWIQITKRKKFPNVGHFDLTKKATELVTNASSQSDEMQNVLYTHLYQLNEMIMKSIPPPV